MTRVVVLVALVAVAACSGSSSSPGDAAAAAGSCTAAAQSEGCFGSCSACTLLTQAQVAAAVGMSVGAGDDAGDPHSCDWAHDDANDIPQLQVLVYANISAKGFEDVCHPRALVDAGITLTAVSGVGDDACFTQLVGLGGPDLTFLKGCWAYEISVFGSMGSDAMIEATETTLAQAALPNL